MVGTQVLQKAVLTSSGFVGGSSRPLTIFSVAAVNTSAVASNSLIHEAGSGGAVLFGCKVAGAAIGDSTVVDFSKGISMSDAYAEVAAGAPRITVVYALSE